MTNVEQTIISQYGNSSAISALIYNMNAYLDPTADKTVQSFDFDGETITLSVVQVTAAQA